MSSTDKTALDGIVNILNGGTTGQVLTKTANGYAWADLVDVTVNPSGS